MNQKEEMIILPVETYSNTIASSNCFVKEQKYNRKKKSIYRISPKIDYTRMW